MKLDMLVEENQNVTANESECGKTRIKKNVALEIAVDKQEQKHDVCHDGVSQ